MYLSYGGRGFAVIRTHFQVSYINLIIWIHYEKIIKGGITISSVSFLQETPYYPDDAFTKVTVMGNVTKVTVMEKYPSKPPTQRISKDLYCDLRTGEVFDIKHTENRSGAIQSTKRSLENIRALVNTNVTVPQNILWCTYTYADNMTDPKRLYQDFDKFKKRYFYWLRKNGYSIPEYISVVEPQGRGAWHCHVFWIWNDKAPFIDNNSVMQKLWGHGFTKTKAVKDVDNIGAYFSAYLSDIPFDDLSLLDRSLVDPSSVLVKQFEDENGFVKEKKFVKGGRMKFYPSGMNLYRCSRGIKMPDTEKMFYCKAQKKVSSLKPTFSRSVAILDVDGCVCNTSTTTYYNSKR